jgi:hypothetical protein
MADREPQTDVDVNILASEVQERFDRAYEFDRENRDAALEDVNFRVGNQWEAYDLLTRRFAKRPTLTINRIPQFIAQVTGEVRRNRPAIRVTPADAAADGQTAQIFEGIIRQIERASSAYRVYSRAVEHSTTAGMGHFRLVLEYAQGDTTDREFKIRTIRDWNSVVWDPDAVEDDKSDARYCFVYETMTEDDFKSKYPDAASSPFAGRKPFAPQPQITRKGGPTVIICEYWKVEDDEENAKFVVRLRHAMSLAETDLINPDEALLNEATQDGWKVIRARKVVPKKIMMYLMAGNQLLAEPYRWDGTRIPVWTVVGQEVDVAGTVIRHGIVRYAKDPQRVLNIARSYEMELLGQSPRVPYVLADEQIEGFEDEWRDANRLPKAYLRYRTKDSDGDQINAPAPRRVDQIATQPGLMAMAQAAGDDMKSTTGIYDASLGARSNETSGVAIEARDAQADTANFVYLDNLTRQMESLGQELVYMIPKEYGAREMIRILGEDDAPGIIALQDQNVDLFRGTYDVIVKTGPSFQSEREEQTRAMVDLAKIVPPPFVPILVAQIAKNGEWKDAEKISDAMMQVAIATGLLPPPPGGPGPMPPGMPPQMAGPGPMPPGLPPGAPPPGFAPPPGLGPGRQLPPPPNQQGFIPPPSFGPPMGTRRPPTMAGPGSFGAS